MRAALWFLALFGVAVALALLAGNNQGVITVFWPPYRIDFSLNLVLLLGLGAFVLLHLALRALAALFALPAQARRWRARQKEQAAHLAFLDALAHLLAGRFTRARKATEAALAGERALRENGQPLPDGEYLRTLGRLLAAESARALQDRAARDEHLRLALEPPAPHTPAAQVLHEGAQLCAARWALDERDAPAALARLDDLPGGAARRTLALRLRLKAARLAGHTLQALDTARLLAKHRAFSPQAARSIVRGLVIDLLDGAHDTAQLQRAWQQLNTDERAIPEVAVHAALRLVALGGEAALARAWLLPVWDRLASAPAGAEALTEPQRIKLARAIEAGLLAPDAGIDRDWLARIEAAQQRNPRDPNLQYLAGMACVKRQLWGKAQQLLTQAAQGLHDPSLHRNAWRALAQLAEQRDDTAAAAQAWKQAAQL